MFSLNSRFAIPKYVPLLILTIGLSLSSSFAIAKVSGPCANCHTMHNSQDGSSMVHSGEDAGWNANGELEGGSDLPINNLLISGCIGCHSSNTDDTIITLGENKIPIVYNLGGYPDNALAGGNFFQVAQPGSDGYGHNVYGISDPDKVLATAPGNEHCGKKTNACHSTLAVEPQSENDFRGGCQGCHYNVYHHGNDNDDHYRFLNSHEKASTGYVEGVEDPFWEHPDHGGQNYYKGVDQKDVANNDPSSYNLKNTQSISSYCGGCHMHFHTDTGADNVWLRHPTDIALPLDGEFADYKPETVDGYNKQAPVAWINPDNPVREEAIVMCLSCHRVHGSEHPDILRWDYSSMVAGISDTGEEGYKETGCFVCHTTKD